MADDVEAGGRQPPAGDRLGGRRVVVTRPRARRGNETGGDELAGLLAAAGAEPLWFPAARLEGPADPAPLRRAAARAATGGYDWVVFTSGNAVARFREALTAAAVQPGPATAGQIEPAAAEQVEPARGRNRETAPSSAIPASVRIACVGPATAAELRSWGVAADVIPLEHVGEALVMAMAGAADLHGARVLFPRAAGARPTVPAGLRRLGAKVEEVEAYRTVPALERASELRRLLDAGGVDALTFMAGSAVEGFVAGAGTDVGGAVVAVIGRVTGEAALRLGLEVHVTASTQTAAGLVRSLEEYWS